MTAHVRGIAGGRLHCQHGPIDLIIGATGPATEIRRAYAAVAEAFGMTAASLEEVLA